MKLLMRPDTYRANTQEGVYFLTYQGPVTLTGPSVARWVDRLAPHLNGTRSLDDLTAHLDTERRTMVERLVTELVSAGIVREVPGPPAAGPPVDAAEERFLSHFLPDPTEAFARYRSSGALVLGPAVLTEPIAQACADSGLGRVVVTTTDPGPPASDTLAELVSEAGIVVYAAATPAPDPDTTRLLRELCTQAGTLLAHLCLAGADIWHGPAGPVPGTASWASGRRLSAAGYRLTPATGGGHALRTAAAQVVQRAFRAMAGLTSPTEHATLVRVDARTHASDHHTFLAHPFDTEPTPRNEAHLRSTGAALRSGEPLDEGTVSRRTAPLVDERTGVFVTFDEDTCTQTPLHVSALTVSDPVNLLGPTGQRPTVLGFGTDFASARYHAAMLGYATYGSLMVDPRHLLEVDVGRGPDEALRDLRTRGCGWARGYRLTDQQPCTVPAERAFPVLTGATPQSWPVTGSAAGYTWHEAVEEALLTHGRQIAVRRLADAHGPFPGVDLDVAPLGERGDHYRGMLEAIGIAPEIYDLSSLLGLPCYLFRVAEAPVSCTVGASSVQALATGMQEVLRHFQASQHAHPRCAPPPSPDLPAASRGPHRPLTPRSVGLEATVAALCRAGASPVAVPLDHDPEVRRRMPYIVQVVLHHD